MPQAKQRYAGLAAWLMLFTMAAPAVVAQADSGSGVITYGAVRLNYDPAKWMVEAGDGPGKWKLTNKKGDAYGHFIVERLQVPEKTLVDFALQEIRSKLGNVKVLSEDTRMSGGAQVKLIRFSGVAKGVAITGQGCYYGGKLGAVQVIAWTGSQLIDEYQSDFDELCDGLEMGQPGTIQNVGPDDTSAASKSSAAKSDAPATPPPPAIFILKNGERIESSSYTLTADSVRVQQGDAERTIPVSALNLDATNAANHARGLDVQIPTSKNQMILSF